MKYRNLLVQDKRFFEVTSSVQPSSELLRLMNGEKITNFNFTVRVGEEPRKKDVVVSREYFSNVVQEVTLLEGRRHDLEGRNTPSKGSHKPDYLLRTTDYAGEQSIVVVGDLLEIKGMADVDRELSGKTSASCHNGWMHALEGKTSSG